MDEDVDFNTKRRVVAWKVDSVRPYRKALQYGKFPRIVHVDQSRSGKTIERLSRQSDLCERIAHLDREETQNVRRQHRSVFAAWIALDRVPFPSTRIS